MRRIEWEPGVYEATKERASALAWAANRRGSRVWTGKNVTADITTYLQTQGYQIGHERVRTVMKKLVRENYAYIRTNEAKKRVEEFGFMPDVDLNGHSLPDVGLDEVRTTVYEQAHTTALPPIPAAPEPPPYRMDELEKLLKRWSEKDHENYAGWVDAAIDSLVHTT